MVYFSIMPSAAAGKVSAGPQAMSQYSKETGSALSALSDAAALDEAELAESSAAGCEHPTIENAIATTSNRHKAIELRFDRCVVPLFFCYDELI